MIKGSCKQARLRSVEVTGRLTSRSIVECRCNEVIGKLLPHLGHVAVEEIAESGHGILLSALVRGPRSRCPRCSVWSERVHSRYRRLLADLPVAGRLVELSLTVRRFFCGNAACGSKTFAEQVDGLTRRRGRRSEPLRATLTSIGLALAGRADVRLAAKSRSPPPADSRSAMLWRRHGRANASRCPHDRRCWTRSLPSVKFCRQGDRGV
jgi:zinc-finger of transposase IS204/IS1001/IS1096/IS1165